MVQLSTVTEKEDPTTIWLKYICVHQTVDRELLFLPIQSYTKDTINVSWYASIKKNLGFEPMRISFYRLVSFKINGRAIVKQKIKF